ncbi:hypothetical protein WG66_010471, partial [Moniliophthora roreri]
KDAAASIFSVPLNLYTFHSFLHIPLPSNPTRTRTISSSSIDDVNLATSPPKSSHPCCREGIRVPMASVDDSPARRFELQPIGPVNERSRVRVLCT